MSIFQSTQTCNTAFADYSAAEPDKNESPLYEELHRRFKVWREYSGASEKDGVRLDNRLSDFPQVVELFVDLLKIISRGLDDARSTQSSQSASGVLADERMALKLKADHSTSHEGSDDTREQKPWSDILLAVNELMKLTTMIRKSSSSNPRYQNAYPAPEGEDAEFELYCPILVRKEFPDARTSLTKLLSNAIIQRRRRLIRQRRRQLERSAAGVMHQARETGPLLSPEDIQGSETAMSEHEHHQPQNSYSPSEISKPGHSIAHLLRDMPLYPPLPQPDSDNPGFAKCPYCFEPLVLPLLAQAWRDHVDKDLQIYVCLSENCATNLKFFDSSTSWIQHMTVHHHPLWPQKIHLGVWYCNLNHSDDASFTTVEGFRAHYEINHPEVYADDRQMKSHIRRDRKPGQRDEHFCPLCENRYDYHSVSLSYSGLLEHIREHLRCLAMLSLPFIDLDILLPCSHPSSHPQFRTSQAPQSSTPWANSPGLGGYYVYVPSTDEIYLHNGRHFPRPANIPRTSPAVTTATYTGTLPPPGLPQHPLPVTGSPPTPMQAPVHPDSPQNLVGATGSMSLNRGSTQRINAQEPVEVVFHQGSTQSQILRKDPPNLRAHGVNMSKSELAGTLFKEYKVRPNPKQFFRVGKVFLVLWSEPAGGTSLVSKWAAGSVINHLGERVFSKVRRFVVIREGGNYCNALPINTYTGRGVAKPGVNKSEHVIIFTGRSAPGPTAQELPAQGQMGMRTIPIQVDPDTLDETLDPMSRLDLGGVTKVEHSIKVKPLGNVNKKSLDALRSQYANVQNHQAGVGTSATPAQYTLHPSTQPPAPQSDEGESEEEDDDDESEDDGSGDDSN